MIGRQLPPLSATARELLADEKQRPAEDAAIKARLLERAREAVAPDRPSGVALRSAAGSAWPKARRAPRAVLLAAAAVAVAGLAAAGAGIYRLRSAPVEAHEVMKTPVDTARAAAAGAAVVAPIQQIPVAPPTAAAPSGPPRAPAPAESAQPANVQQYAVELGVLEPARSSIARGDFGGAMAPITRHQREYPRGQLAQEREALRVRALWGMGQKTQAESAAAAFRKRYPRSGLLSWLKEPAKPTP